MKNFPGYDYETYTDSGISGKNIEGRPAMKRLLQDVKDNKIEMVLSWKLNRISSLNETCLILFMNSKT